MARRSNRDSTSAREPSDVAGPAPDPAADERFMKRAWAEARAAEDAGDVPVGCIVVREGRVVGRGRNQRELLQDPTAHAEILAITGAAAEAGSWRLDGCTLYVTLEPCAMCAGAIVLARIPRVVFGAHDPKAGACGSLMNLVQDPRLNHRAELVAGVHAAPCADLLRQFFARLRSRVDEPEIGG
jgi:tRNA(adenine34) deaminase